MRLLLALSIGLLLAGAIALRPGSSGAAPSERYVISATWQIGIPMGRFTRREWYDPVTGGTRRQDGGGPVCARTTVAGAGRIASFGCSARRLFRVKGPRDPRLLWQTSDLLRPKRLLRLRQASIVGPVMVGQQEALRVRLPINRTYGEGPFTGNHFADVDQSTQLPLRFVFEVDGQIYAYNIVMRRVRRSSLPPGFFSTRR
jgi:hypothetical protein